MAKSSSCVLGLACFVAAVAVAGATQFTVGGPNGWSVPAAGAEPFNTWAEKIRFQIGDSLLFVYPKDEDSVLLVEPADYNACNTSSYVRKFDDGDTVFTLDRSGPLFFISGVEANCRANEKLIVMVLAAGRSNGSAPAPSAPAPPPASPSSPPPASPTAPPPSSSPAPKSPPATASPPPAATSAPPPAASAPTTTPSTPPPASSSSPPAPSASSPAPVSSVPPSAPAGAPQPPPPAPSVSSPAPSARGTTANATGTASPPPAGSKDKNGAALTMAATGLAGSLGACVLGYAMLAL